MRRMPARRAHILPQTPPLSCVPGAHVAERRLEVGGDKIRRADIRPPDLIDRLSESIPKLQSRWVRVRAVFRERKVELQHFRGQGLDRRVLPRIHVVSRPDEKAEGERREQREEIDDRADLSRDGPVVCFSGSIRCRTSPIAPQANSPAAMAKAIFSGLMTCEASN
jgi:hypothetical protein